MTDRLVGRNGTINSDGLPFPLNLPDHKNQSAKKPDQPTLTIAWYMWSETFWIS